MAAMLEVTIKWGESVLHVERVRRDGPHRLGGPCRELWGDTPLPLPSQGDAVVALDDDVRMVVSSFEAEEPPAPIKPSRLVVSLFALSACFHAAFIAAMWFYTPKLAGTDDADIGEDREALIKELLDAHSLREEQAPNEAAPIEELYEGGTGVESKGEPGSMGAAIAPVANRRYAVEGPPDNHDPHLARISILADAHDFVMVGLVQAIGDPDAPTAPWGRDDPFGDDPASAHGHMWGDDIGEAAGAGGLGLTGVGEGGGGRVPGIGIGRDGVFGHGAGFGVGSSFGDLPGSHRSRGPVCHCGGSTMVSGRMPPEVIQRVVRSNFGRFRLCYEKGLMTNPSLSGTVSVAFVIGEDGSVASSRDSGSGIPDRSVVSCVVRAFGGLSFPSPEGGSVRVTYPIAFSPT